MQLHPRRRLLPVLVALAAVALGSQLITVELYGDANAKEAQAPPYKAAQRSPMDPKAEQVLRDMADRLESVDQ